MIRTTRVMELADLLRGGEPTTVEALAERLGVSGRTVRRDLATLRETGMPIESEPGPGGGVVLRQPRGVAAVHLADDEIVTLWLSARLARAASDLPWSRSAEHALSKLLASLPPTRQRSLRALCRRVVVGPPASTRVASDAGLAPSELVRLVEAAFTRGTGLAFGYRDRHGERTTREVEPHGLLVQSPVWYLLARDLGKGEPRMFRMDRIDRPRAIAHVAFRPDPLVIRALLPELEGFTPLLGALPSGS